VLPARTQATGFQFKVSVQPELDAKEDASHHWPVVRCHF